ncbi:MAG: hypothetical protein SPL03_13100 [Succinivibrio dextrinosolvens]|nr:hypothetical protein [Succinivibrio dextrinosolvens]
MKKVFESSNLKKLKLKNRLIRSATWEGIASEDGSVSEETYEIYDKGPKPSLKFIAQSSRNWQRIMVVILYIKFTFAERPTIRLKYNSIVIAVIPMCG